MKVRRFFTKRIAIAAAAAIAIASVALPGATGIMNNDSVSADGVDGRFYLSIGDIKGSSMDEGHNDWINLLSVSQSITRPISTSGSVRRRSGAQFSDIVVVKEVDPSTPKLQEAIASGKVFPKVEIHLTAFYGGKQHTYLNIELTNVMVSNYSINGSADGGSLPMEELALNFEEIKTTHSEIGANGSGKGDVEFNWKVGEGLK